MTATDRKLWRLIAVAAPFLLLASLAYVGAGSGSWLRLVINGAVCGTYIATGLLAWSRRPANRTGRFMVAVGLLLLLDPLQDGTLPSLILVGRRGDDRVGHPARLPDPGVPVGHPPIQRRPRVPRGQRGGVALRQSGGPRRLRPASGGHRFRQPVSADRRSGPGERGDGPVALDQHPRADRIPGDLRRSLGSRVRPGQAHLFAGPRAVDRARDRDHGVDDHERSRRPGRPAPGCRHHAGPRPGPDPGRLPRRSAPHADGPLGGRRSRRRARRDADPGPPARRPRKRARRPGPHGRLLVARDRRLPRRRWIAGCTAIRRTQVGP